MQEKEFLDKLKTIQQQIQSSNNSLIQTTTEGLLQDAIESMAKIQRQDYQDPSFEIVKKQLNQCYQFAMCPGNLNKQWIINFTVKKNQKEFVQILRDISEELKNRVIDGQSFSTIQGIIQLDSILVLDAIFTFRWEGLNKLCIYQTSLLFNKIANNTFKHNLQYDRMQQKEPQLKQLIDQQDLLYDFCNFTIDVKKQRFSIKTNHQHVGYNLTERCLIGLAEDMKIKLSPINNIEVLSLLSKHNHTNHPGMLYPQCKYMSDSEKLQAPYVIVEYAQTKYQLEINSELGQNIGLDKQDTISLQMVQGDFFYFTSKEKRNDLKFIPNIRYNSMLFCDKALNFNLELVLQDKVCLTISSNLQNVWNGLNTF